MANKLYPAAKEKFLTGALNLETAPLKLALVSSTYVYSDAHTDYDADISADAIGTPQDLTTPSVTIVGARAVFDADSDINFGVIASGDTIGSMVIYDNTSKTPVAYIDDAAGLPFVTNDGTVEVDFSTGVNKVFAF